ncbi:tRNA pseudouridine synthase [Agrocybe pediades]|nr:tRNA pseudouridine synthase [Agrocybe pediades]
MDSESGDAIKREAEIDVKRPRLDDESVGAITSSNNEDGIAVGTLSTSENVAAAPESNPQAIPEPSADRTAEPKEEEAGNEDSTEGKGKGKKRPPRRTAERTKEYKGRGRGGRAPSYRDKNQDKPREVSLGPDGEELPKAMRLPKRQCALLLGFCGSGYNGMQVQPEHSNTKTIEGTLFKALVKVGAVSQDNADNPVKVNLARAARTDAGVHAAGNVVSLKMIMDIPGVDDLVTKINDELPPEIRLWGYVRTQNSFNARMICESRKYTYYFPTYLLIPPKPTSNFYRIWSENVKSSEGADSAPSISYEFWEGHDNSTKEEDMARKRAWRINPEQVEQLRLLVKRYEGTHNFHNFTVARDFTDRSNNRFMRKIEVSDPVVYGETEWISVLFHGQSFMLHQIRKMMAILVLSCRMGTPPRVISELYGQRSVFVPKMPSLGLLLEEPLFDSYNQRMGVINEKLKPTDPEYRPLIDFDQYRDQINAFKEKFIYTNMRQVEDRDGLFDAWVRMIDAYAGNDLLYLNPSGAVPDAAVIVKGARRENPFREKKIFDTTSFPENGGIRKKLEESEDVDMDANEEEEEVLDKKQLAETEG